ncbi:IS66 family insertion sequence element accessory protein TnpB [Bradyrhizobium sp. IC3123]|nr:IS66 family insertion sequence element accessory protein TnpB [Bradyrhizobium sp. IC3123]MCA1438490.1 IS66 family insertion sequence element accessory protein TnpB [Bradyrhizobium sp. BRP20]MCA1473293.1 IS66 family insertion sequence element accessory protein TnpB [Bradyrhizobium sp. IC3195]MCA1502163.1 IS66 family insertion sequence element accessory protein TnpB [Bradyrhizobium sp. NBAIM14]MCA1552480.1 IS66 family insertion sequence element accessory protein TnpB [Bradyrhizobium sp. BRP19]
MAAARTGLIEIDLGNRWCIWGDAHVDPKALAQVLDCLDADDCYTGNVRMWLATGYTDMRRSFPSRALQAQEVLHKDPLSGHLFVFRGRRSDLVKAIWNDG